MVKSHGCQVVARSPKPPIVVQFWASHYNSLSMNEAVDQSPSEPEIAASWPTKCRRWKRLAIWTLAGLLVADVIFELRVYPNSSTDGFAA